MMRYGKFGFKPYEFGYKVGTLSVRKNKDTGEDEEYLSSPVWPSNARGVIRYLQRQVRMELAPTTPEEVSRINRRIEKDLALLLEGEA